MCTIIAHLFSFRLGLSLYSYYEFYQSYGYLYKLNLS